MFVFRKYVGDNPQVTLCVSYTPLPNYVSHITNNPESSEGDRGNRLETRPGTEPRWECSPEPVIRTEGIVALQCGEEVRYTEKARKDIESVLENAIEEIRKEQGGVVEDIVMKELLETQQAIEKVKALLDEKTEEKH